MNTQEIMQAAANDVISYLMKAYKTERGIHAETLIGAIAAITGEHVLWASHTHEQLTGSGWVMSPEANNLLFEDDRNINIYQLLSILTNTGAADMPNMEDIIERTAKSVGGSPFPPLSLDQKHYPHEWSPNSAFTHRQPVMNIAEKYSLDAHGRAIMLGCATASTINMTAQTLDKKISLQLALEIITGLTKMKPLEKLYQPD